MIKPGYEVTAIPVNWKTVVEPPLCIRHDMVQKTVQNQYSSLDSFSIWYNSSLALNNWAFTVPRGKSSLLDISS
jgi:hypothetical protein